MREADRLKRNAAMLAECHPWFQIRVTGVIARLERQGRRPRIQCAWRSLAQQAAEVAEGDSQVLYGFHNVTGMAGRPESFAVDLLDDDDPLDQDAGEPGSVYFLMLATAAEAEGLKTLIRWGLTPDQRSRIDTAIEQRDYHAAVRVGKDPTHVQPGPGSQITAERLRGGWRPAVWGGQGSGLQGSGAAVASSLTQGGQESGAAALSSTSSPSLSEAVDLAGELGPLPTPHECGSYGYQLEQDMKRLDQVGFLSALAPEMRDRLEAGVPRWITDACRIRMVSAAGDRGAYRRKFHGEPWDAGDVQRHLAWWIAEVQR